MSLESDFFTLFEGRRDCYGTNEGGCVKAPATGQLNWEHLIDGHLNGDKPIGIYPARADQLTRWGCIDWDTPDAWDHAEATHAALGLVSINSWIERSRSKGFHLWVFADDWIPMGVMRIALMGACQLADTSIKEVNPKSLQLAEGQHGNYVRLPYPKTRGGGQCVVDARRGPDYEYSLVAFVAEALQFRNSYESIDNLAAMYCEPVRAPRPVVPLTASSTEAESRMGGLAWTIYSNGPKDGGDRSSALMALAGAMRRNGKLAYSEALDLMLNADDRWGKYTGRPNQVELLESTMQKAGW